MFDVVVIGGGHAGCEAVNAASLIGAKVAMITFSKNNIGQLSCNPSIGGIGKSHLVSEVDSMGGLMGEICDKSSIHSNVLNTKKGYAVRAPRFQIDREIYSKNMTDRILSLKGVSIIEDEALKIITCYAVGEKIVKGVLLRSGKEIKCRSIVICTGTFIDGKIFYGDKSFSSGRKGENACVGLGQNLIDLGFKVERLRTSTPPRVAFDSIDWSLTEEQYPMMPSAKMSFFSEEESCAKQISCYISKTNSQTHEIVKKNLKNSAMNIFSLSSKPPRYCISIERKIINFADKLSHNLFLEPEGLSSERVYVNGLSNGLPKEVQKEMIRSIDCFYNANICDYGYVVEYSFCNPIFLKRTLETKLVKNLFFAGQINGTTGYEEAAGQGLLAGINAALSEEKEFTFSRASSYIGTMVDDLVSCCIEEPYRMFTSRSEFRLFLRVDNADIRLIEQARELGMIDLEKYKKFVTLKKERESLVEKLKAHKIVYGGRSVDGFSYLSYTDDFEGLLQSSAEVFNNFSKKTIDFCRAEAKYLPYLERATKQAKDLDECYGIKIPKDINYKDINCLSREAREQLELHRPEDIASARKIQGVTPAAISFLLAKIKQHNCFT